METIERIAKALQGLDVGKGIEKPWPDYLAEAGRFAVAMAALSARAPIAVKLNRPSE